ncbi:MAG: hypothetical protein P9L94_06930 [Candidatus Hinthialibacter antarcticus]|nr:hypothetical protein [Candidatus Hinthialibacter antarcticus]
MLIIAAVTIIVIILLVLLIVMFSSSGGGEQKSLLAELGLTNKWSGEKTSPFYKWGWKKTSSDRVWGERIVKKAFREAGIWLSPDDLNFFQRKCEENTSGKSMNDKSIMERVELVVKRTDTISGSISQQIRLLVDRLFSATEEEAVKFLKEMKIEPENTPALGKLTSIEFKRFIRHAGLQMFSPLAKGLKIEGKTEQESFVLRGFESWCYWLSKLKSELKQQLEKNKGLRSHIVGRALQQIILDKLLRSLEDDYKSSLSYRSNIEQQLQDLEINLTPDEIENSESLLFTWQFTEKMAFSEYDHKKYRQFMVTKELCPAFREGIVRKLQSNTSSARSMLKVYPRDVIFYGDNYEVRTYTTKMYQAHLKALINVFAVSNKDSLNGPEIIAITLDDIYKARKEVDERMAELQTLPPSKRKEVTIDREYLTRIIDKRKQYSAFERQIDQAVAESHGWIIDIPLGKDLRPDEYRELKSGKFVEFVMYECTPEIEVDLQSNSTLAKKKRNEFLPTVLKALSQLSGGGLGGGLGGDSPPGTSSPEEPEAGPETGELANEDAITDETAGIDMVKPEPVEEMVNAGG